MRHQNEYSRALALALMCLCLLIACADKPLPTSLGQPPLQQVQIQALPGANKNSATALDIVLVYEPSALAALPRTGPQWFANKQALLGGLGASVAVVAVEIPPAKTLVIELPQRPGLLAAVGFANYMDAQGQAAATLPPFRCVRMTLEATAVAYARCNESPP